MSTFSYEEYADMHLVYGFCGCSARAARQEYGVRYPHRRLPSIGVFIRLHECLRRTGRFPTNLRELGNQQTDVGLEQTVIDRVMAQPDISTRDLARAFGISQFKVCEILKKEKLYPYHVQKIQVLHTGDNYRRKEFCCWLVQSDTEEHHFFHRILWSDESNFTRDGVFNTHNLHQYSHQNPHASRQQHSQRRFSINVWAGVIGNVLIGPYLDFPARLTGPIYLNFIQNMLPTLLEDLPLQLRRNIIFQHDGAPPHSSRLVQAYLNRTFETWIGRGGTVPWPPRSPDLNPMDYFVWGYLKELVYRTEVTNVDDLRARIFTAAEKLRRVLSFGVTVGSMRKRARLCISENGFQFEQKLK